MNEQNQNAPVVAIVGATGAVGVEMIHCLESRNFPLSRLKLLASPRSAGRKMKFKGEEITVEPLSAWTLLCSRPRVPSRASSRPSR